MHGTKDESSDSVFPLELACIIVLVYSSEDRRASRSSRADDRYGDSDL